MSKATIPVKKKKKPKNYYFTQTTENAIIRYNKSDDPRVRNKIYNDHINYAFDKLAENIIHTFKFYYFDVPPSTVKLDVVSFLVMNIHKFQEGKGKAFSYFSIVAKNYLILHNNGNYKKYKIHDKIERLDFKRNISSEASAREGDEVNTEFVVQMIEYWDNNLTNIFQKPRDIKIADSVIELFRRKESIDNFNKKALYILIREMTGYTTQHITRVVNVMKKYHTHLFRSYLNSNQIDTRDTGSFLFEE
jgi:hypothetical protein